MSGAGRLPERAGPLPLGLLAAAAFLSSAGARVMDPLLHPVSRDFGVMVTELWVVIAAYTLPYGLIQLVLGPIGDRFGKLRLILGSVVCYAVFMGACSLASGLPSLAVLRGFAGAASAAIIPVSMAYIGDAVPYGQRQVTLSKFLIGIVLAQTLAGPVGGWFGEYVGWRGVFLLLGGLAVLVAAGFIRRLRRLPDLRAPGRMFKPENYLRLVRQGTGRTVLIAATLDGVLFVGCFPYLAPYMHESQGLSYAEVGLVLACFGGGAYAYLRLARPLVEGLGESGLVLLGGVLMSAALVLAAVSRLWIAFVPMELMLGLGFYMFHSVLQAEATEMLPQARATAVAMFSCFLFMGQAIGALLNGYSIARFGFGPAFMLDAAGILGLSAWLWWTLRRAPSEAHE